LTRKRSEVQILQRPREEHLVRGQEAPLSSPKSLRLPSPFLLVCGRDVAHRPSAELSAIRSWRSIFRQGLSLVERGSRARPLEYPSECHQSPWSTSQWERRSIVDEARMAQRPPCAMDEASPQLRRAAPPPGARRRTAGRLGSPRNGSSRTTRTRRPPCPAAQPRLPGATPRPPRRR
jgi:hypothetical protein